MNIDDLVAKYPKLFHMADKRNWHNITKHGLLSTTALLDLYEYHGHKRSEIESQLRTKEFLISHTNYGVAVIRDQDPMRDRPSEGMYLKNCLDGIGPREWFEFLNRKTFFWTTEKGLNFMLGARLYRNGSHYVLTVNTRKLLDQHADNVELSAINSGSLYGMKKRSRETFQSITQFHAPWINELTVDYSISNILDLIISVDECKSHRDIGMKESICKPIKRIFPE